jgi:hypothetical protein
MKRYSGWASATTYLLKNWPAFIDVPALFGRRRTKAAHSKTEDAWVYSFN